MKKITDVNRHFADLREANILDAVRRGETIVLEAATMKKLAALREKLGFVDLSALVGALIDAEADRLARLDKKTDEEG